MGTSVEIMPVATRAIYGVYAMYILCLIKLSYSCLILRTQEGGGDLDEFFAMVDDMRNKIQTMKTKSAAMKKLTADLLLQTDDTKFELEKELDGLVSDVKKVSNHITGSNNSDTIANKNNANGSDGRHS